MRHIILIVAVIYINSINADPVKSYNGYTVERITPNTNAELDYLRELERTENELDFWTSPVGLNIPVDIMFPPHLKRMFSSILRTKSITKSELISDVGRSLKSKEKHQK